MSEPTGNTNDPKYISIIDAIANQARIDANLKRQIAEGLGVEARYNSFYDDSSIEDTEERLRRGFGDWYGADPHWRSRLWGGDTDYVIDEYLAELETARLHWNEEPD